MSISGLTISNGRLAPLAGAFDFNPRQGGGIFNAGTLTVTNSVVSGNAVVGGVSIGFIGAGSGAGQGGGIFNTGTLTVTGSTISGNSATGGTGGNGDATNPAAGAVGAGQGGGIFQGTIAAGIGPPPPPPPATTTQSVTITANTVAGGSAGTGTPAGAAGTGSGGGFAVTTGTTTLRSTVVAENTGDANAPDVIGAFAPASSFNLIGIGDGATGITSGTNNNQVGTASAPIDPLLGPLQNNGGPTPTHAISSGSPAIDKGIALKE